MEISPQKLLLPSKWRMTSKSVLKFTQVHDMLTKTVHATLYKDLQLSKKSARWVTKMLYEKIKKERLEMCEAVMSMIAVTS
jgi:hypothetical protein